MAEFLSIPLNRLRPSRHQARKTFDPQALAELAASMNAEGQLQPVLVRKLDASSFELISGERRFRAAMKLGWKAIDACLIDVEDEADSAVKGLVENLQREDLNPMEEAEGFAELQNLDKKRWSQAVIAGAIGRSQGYVSQSFLLLGLPAQVQENIRRLIFSRSHGIELTRLPDESLQLDVARQIGDKLTVKETRALVDDILAGSKAAKTAARTAPRSTDPMEGQWARLLSDPRFHGLGAWAAAWNGKGWNFSFTPAAPEPKVALAAWFLAMAEGLGGTSSQPAARAITKARKAMVDRTVNVLRKVAPKSKAEAEAMKFETHTPRLPKTPAEQKELEAIARQGPGPVYAWIYGADSQWAKQMAGMAWAEMAVTDPLEGLSRLLDGIQQVQNLRAPGGPRRRT